MADTHPRSNLQMLDAPHQESAAGVVASNLGYRCSVCGCPWPYQAVRNTGRCPACGSGLLREGDHL